MRGVAALLAVWLLLLAGCGTEGTFVPSPDSTLPEAPDFELLDLGGKAVRLADYRGRTVVLCFWASWCGPCRTQMTQLERVQSQVKEKKVALLTISLDGNLELLRTYLRENPLQFPVVRGTNRVVAAYGGIRGVPTTFILNRDLRIARKFVGARNCRNVPRSAG